MKRKEEKKNEGRERGEWLSRSANLLNIAVAARGQQLYCRPIELTTRRYCCCCCCCYSV